MARNRSQILTQEDIVIQFSPSEIGPDIERILPYLSAGLLYLLIRRFAEQQCQNYEELKKKSPGIEVK